MTTPRLLPFSSLSTYIAKCNQCGVSFSAPAHNLDIFVDSYLRLATEFRLIQGIWRCGHCHHTGPDLVSIAYRASYQLFEGNYPAWVIIDTRGHWVIETYIRNDGPESKNFADRQVAGLNEYEGYNRWIVVKTSPIPKTLRKNPDEHRRQWERLAQTGGVEERARFLRQELRAGKISLDQLRVAAILGDTAAYLVISPTEEGAGLKPAVKFEDMVRGYEQLVPRILSWRVEGVYPDQERIFRRAMSAVRTLLAEMLRAQAKRMTEIQDLPEGVSENLFERALRLHNLRIVDSSEGNRIPLQHIRLILFTSFMLLQPKQNLSQKIRLHYLNSSFRKLQKAAIEEVFSEEIFK